MSSSFSESATCTTGTDASVERIYIGGLDPTRLTPAEIVARIQSTVLLSSSSDWHVARDISNNDQTYFYMTVRRDGTSSDDTTVNCKESALGLIAKQYHNVKWKGSKLRVEAARPHLLQRLEQEREERRRQRDEQMSNAGRAGDTASSCRIMPRHLRIRQRFGQEAHMIDTKPVRVDEWSGFARAVTRMKTKREKQGEPLQIPFMDRKKQAHCNRSVHLRFHDENDDASDDRGVPLLVEAQSSSTSTASSSDMDDVETNRSNGFSGPSSDEESTSTVGKNRGQAYVWSDDDESDKDGDDARRGSYSWSSSTDEDVSSDRLATNHRSPGDPASTDQFSADIAFGDNDEDSTGSSESSDHDVVSNSMNLYDDVKSNLGVLSSIFPDMASAAPVELHERNTVDKDRLGENEIPTMQPGWERPGSSLSGIGIMQRFDPTKESAQKYVLEQPSIDDIDADDTATSDQSRRGDDVCSDNEIHSVDEQESPAEGQSSHSIYQQGKLEDVFRHAREVEGNLSEKETASQGAGFAFGFDLKDSKPQDDELAKPSGDEGFAFAFHLAKQSDDVPQNNSQVVADSGLITGRHNEGQALCAEKIDQPFESRKQLFRRKGLLFPSSVLQQYTEAFFSMNEGARIQGDLEGFQQDDEIKQKWLRERYGLTQDWKRKKKYAQSRLQKRTKFR